MSQASTPQVSVTAGQHWQPQTCSSRNLDWDTKTVGSSQYILYTLFFTVAQWVNAFCLRNNGDPCRSIHTLSLFLNGFIVIIIKTVFIPHLGNSSVNNKHVSTYSYLKEYTKVNMISNQHHHGGGLVYKCWRTQLMVPQAGLNPIKFDGVLPETLDKRVLKGKTYTYKWKTS